MIRAGYDGLRLAPYVQSPDRPSSIVFSLLPLQAYRARANAEGTRGRWEGEGGRGEGGRGRGRGKGSSIHCFGVDKRPSSRHVDLVAARSWQLETAATHADSVSYRTGKSGRTKAWTDVSYFQHLSQSRTVPVQYGTVRYGTVRYTIEQ